MNTVEGRPQFVDAVSQVVAIRPPQFVPFRLQPGKIDVALGVRFRRQPGEPLDNRNRAILFQVVNESCLRRATSSLFVNLRTLVNPGRLAANSPHVDLAGHSGRDQGRAVLLELGDLLAGPGDDGVKALRCPETRQPELRDFSAVPVRSANSASCLVSIAAAAATGSFLGRPRTQCRPNCSESPLTNSSSPNGRPA